MLSRLTLRINYYSNAFVSQLWSVCLQQGQGVHQVITFLYYWASLVLTQKNHHGVGEPSGASIPSGYCNRQGCVHLPAAYPQKSASPSAATPSSPLGPYFPSATRTSARSCSSFWARAIASLQTSTLASAGRPFVRRNNLDYK